MSLLAISGLCWRRWVLPVLSLIFSATPAMAGSPISFGVTRAAPDGRIDIVARSYFDLGVKLAEAQAEDRYCDITEFYLDVAGQRSRYQSATPASVDADFIARVRLRDAAAAFARRDRQGYSESEVAYLKGYADGYNRFAANDSLVRRLHPACANKPMRAFRLDPVVLAGEKRYTHCRTAFDAEIAAARPPGDAVASSYHPAFPAPGPRLASTGWAFGAELSANGRGILIGQPHDEWMRYSPVRLTIPGRLDLFGFTHGPGIPALYAWTNGSVASTMTCQSGEIYAIFRLPLTPGSPLRYLEDGRARPLTPVAISVEARRPDGGVDVRKRTFYRTDRGWIIGGKDFPWTADHAFVVQEVSMRNPDPSMIPFNDRAAAVRTAAELADLTIALERNDNIAQYIADRDGGVAAVPNDVVIALPEAQLAACRVADPRTNVAADTALPILDGARSSCRLVAGKGTTTAGVIARAAIPVHRNRRVVMGSNQSVSLLNPEHLLLGYDRFIDRASAQQLEEQRWTGRYKEHAEILRDRAAGTDGAPPGRWSTEDVLRIFLQARGHWARILKPAVIDACVNAARREAALMRACTVLRDWDGTATATSRGAIFWREFWRALPRATLPPDRPREGMYPDIFAVPFDPREPYATPRGLADAKLPLIIDVLRNTIARFDKEGVALDIPLGEAQRYTSGGREWPLPGCDNADGCENVQADTWADKAADRGGLRQSFGPDRYRGGNIMFLVGFEDDGSTRIRYGGPTLTAFNRDDAPAFAAGPALWAEGKLIDLRVTFARKVAGGRRHRR